MYTLEQLSSLVDLVYESMLDSKRWPEFLRTFAATLDGHAPVLFHHDVHRLSGNVAIGVGYGPEAMLKYRDYYAARNPWLRSRPELLRSNSVRTSHMMCSRRELLRSEFYGDYLRPLGIEQGIGATLMTEGASTANISVFAGTQRQDFSAPDMQLLTALLPHLGRALQVQRRLGESALRERALLETTESVAAGVVLVDAAGRVLFMNETAHAQVARGDGLEVDREGLRAARADDTRALRKRIAEAALTSAGDGLNPGGRLRIRRPSGQPSLELLISPLPLSEEHWCFTGEAAALICINDPSVPDQPPTGAIAQMHGLSRGESRVLAGVAAGKSAVEVARELGVSYNTIKTHLRHLFAKTGTRSQRELIRLVHRTATVRARSER